MGSRKFILLFLTLLGAITASGRDFTSYQTVSQPKLRLVTSVCVDDNNFVWASNRMGVVRFSSTAQQGYRLPRGESSVSSVNLLKYQGTIFAYNDKGGVFRYNELTDSFERYLDFSGMIDAIFFSVKKIVPDNAGRFWISSSAGLLMYDEKAGLSAVAGTSSVTENASISCTSDGRVFIVSSGGIIEIDGDPQKKYMLYPEDSQLASASSYFDESLGRLWIGTVYDGLKYFDLAERKVVDVPGSSTLTVRAMTPYKDNVLLVGFDGDGIWFIDKNTGEVLEKEQKDYNRANSLGSNGVYDICYRCSTIYVATYSGGLFSCDDYVPPIVHCLHRLNDANSLSDDNIHSVFEDSMGRNVAATDNGVSIYDIGARKWTHICKGNICTHAMEDSHGRLWVATYGNGWFVYDLGSMALIEHRRTSPMGKSELPMNVKNFLEDRDGDIWILGTNLILRKDHISGQYQEYSPYCVAGACLLPDGSIGLACSHALVVLDKYENSEKILWEGDVHDIEFDGNGIWAGTSGNGVLYLTEEGEISNTLTTRDGLSSDFISSVMLVGDDLWIGTEIGLNKYDVASDRIQTFNNIPILGNSNFNNDASDIQKDGALLFGTGEGMLKFHAEQMLHQVGHSKLYVDNIRFAGVSVRDMLSIAPNQVQEVKVKHSQNNAIFTFISSGVGNYSYLFKWKMDPVDGAWSPLQEDGRCRYTNLPSGKNVFHVVMTDALGTEVDSRDIIIDVATPYWRTWWFALIMLLIVYLLVQSLWIWYSMKIKQRVVPMVNISREVEKHVSMRGMQEKDPFVEKAVEVVYARMQDPDFDKDSFASAMNVSASSLYKKLKSLTGQSPAEFIKTIRMSTALNLLQSHQHTITEVSEMCGYSSQSYFSTAFKNFYGKTPNEI